MGTIVSFNKTLESRGTDASNSKGQKHACSGVKSTEQGARHVPNTVSNHNDLLNKYEKSKSPPPGHDLSHQDASKNLVKPQDTTRSSQGGGIPPESKAVFVHAEDGSIPKSQAHQEEDLISSSSQRPIRRTKTMRLRGNKSLSELVKARPTPQVPASTASS